DYYCAIWYSTASVF
nr:immunoglobulin light chain junction region [Macaca mulatta]MOW05714.1 immunoglobulin light chain junction region [Macaca mulatta]MOW07335.1 immunoglobulin light chain junction region [Macaca mulatta]